MGKQLYGPGVPTQYNNVQDYTNAVAAFKNGTGYQPTIANKALGGQGGYVPGTAPQGTSSGNQTQQPQQQQQQQEQTVDPYAQVRNDISSAWDNYLNTLQGTSGYFDEQRTAQEGVVNSQLQQGITTANESKANSLRDIANTTRNAFQAGNNYLGAMGAGDSSAANQYSFAINQQANKQTGDLNNFVQSKIQELQSTHDQQVQQIASWFAQQQQTLKQQIAQGQLSKGQDIANLSKQILDQAMQATNTAKQNSQAQYNALLTWAGNNSTNLGQLGQNISQIGSMFNPGQVSTVGAPSTGGYFPGGGGGGGTPTNEKLDIFGRPIG